MSISPKKRGPKGQQQNESRWAFEKATNRFRPFERGQLDRPSSVFSAAVPTSVDDLRQKLTDPLFVLHMHLEARLKDAFNRAHEVEDWPGCAEAQEPSAESNRKHQEDVLICLGKMRWLIHKWWSYYNIRKKLKFPEEISNAKDLCTQKNLWTGVLSAMEAGCRLLSQIEEGCDLLIQKERSPKADFGAKAEVEIYMNPEQLITPLRHLYKLVEFFVALIHYSYHFRNYPDACHVLHLIILIEDTWRFSTDVSFVPGTQDLQDLVLGIKSLKYLANPLLGRLSADFGSAVHYRPDFTYLDKIDPKDKSKYSNLDFAYAQSVFGKDESVPSNSNRQICLVTNMDDYVWYIYLAIIRCPASRQDWKYTLATRLMKDFENGEIYITPKNQLLMYVNMRDTAKHLVSATALTSNWLSLKEFILSSSTDICRRCLLWALVNVDDEYLDFYRRNDYRSYIEALFTVLLEDSGFGLNIPSELESQALEIEVDSKFGLGRVPVPQNQNPSITNSENAHTVGASSDTKTEYIENDKQEKAESENAYEEVKYNPEPSSEPDEREEIKIEKAKIEEERRALAEERKAIEALRATMELEKSERDRERAELADKRKGFTHKRKSVEEIVKAEEMPALGTSDTEGVQMNIPDQYGSRKSEEIPHGYPAEETDSGNSFIEISHDDNNWSKLQENCSLITAQKRVPENQALEIGKGSENAVPLGKQRGLEHSVPIASYSENMDPKSKTMETTSPEEAVLIIERLKILGTPLTILSKRR